jgi:hypothetical protein
LGLWGKRTGAWGKSRLLGPFAMPISLRFALLPCPSSLPLSEAVPCGIVKCIVHFSKQCLLECIYVDLIQPPSDLLGRGVSRSQRQRLRRFAESDQVSFDGGTQERTLSRPIRTLPTPKRQMRLTLGLVAQRPTDLDGGPIGGSCARFATRKSTRSRAPPVKEKDRLIFCILCVYLMENVSMVGLWGSRNAGGPDSNQVPRRVESSKRYHSQQWLSFIDDARSADNLLSTRMTVVTNPREFSCPFCLC